MYAHSQFRYSFFPIAFMALLIFAGLPNVRATDIQVNSTDDAEIDALPGNGVCETIPGNGKCTLRAAVMEANALPGPDTIHLQGGAVYFLTRPNPIGPAEDIVGAGGDLDLINDDITILGNGATIDGSAIERVIQVAGNITASFSDLTIRNGSDGNGGGIFTQGQLTLTRCVVRDSVATTNGGGIYTANGTLTLNSSTVSGNESMGNFFSTGGGGLFVASGTANLIDSFLLNNTCIRIGAGAMNAGTLSLLRTTVMNNTATLPALLGAGGLVNGGLGGPPGGTITIDNSTITNNSGGGIGNNTPGVITITASDVSSNPRGIGLDNRTGATLTLIGTTVTGHTNDGGAGISNRGELILSSDSVVADNVVTSNTGGSAIANRGPQANVQINNSTIRNNRTTGQFPRAAAILNDSGAQMMISDSVVAQNTGGQAGGGVYNTYTAGTVAISGCTIRDNRVLAPFGAGIGVFTNNNCTITDTVFSGNVAGGSGSGGGLQNDTEGTLTIRDCTFVNNQAHSAGGLQNFGTATIERCVFHANSASSTAGGVAIGGAKTTTMTNCTISGNSGGGLAAAFQTTTNLDNVTIAANNGPGLTISAASGAVVNMQNSIVADNTGSQCFLGGVTTLGHNIASDGSCGLTDASDLPNTDPMLGPLDANGGLSLTHRLRFGSPAIDSADAAACPNNDQRSFPRPADGDNDGISQCDIGAYEQQFADCDNNGVFDLLDIDVGTWSDDNQNGVPDICEVPGDIDGNGVVDLTDYARFPRCFDGPGSTAVSVCTRTDTDGDGDVDLVDFADVQTAFSTTP